MKRRTMLLALPLLLNACAGPSSQPPPVAAPAAAPGKARVGAPCPPFSFTTLDGKPVSLADYRGKAVLIDLWSVT